MLRALVAVIGTDEQVPIGVGVRLFSVVLEGDEAGAEVEPAGQAGLAASFPSN